MSKLNNDLHDRVHDLEGQVIKANENLELVLSGMEEYVMHTVPILKGPFLDMLHHVKKLIDWELVIDVSRYEEEKNFRQ